MGTDFEKSNSKCKMYEEVIKQIRGVINNRVVLDKDGNFEEVHIIANLERSPKQIVRDVETLAMVAFGIHLDHKIVSVVQMSEENFKVDKVNIRPSLQGINTSLTKQKINATVDIVIKDQAVAGSASGSNSPLNRLRVVAKAVLNAIEKFYERKVSFSVDEIAKIKFGVDEIIIVSIFLIIGESEDTLIGVAFIRGDEKEAVCKAVLNAINRKISGLSLV